MLVNFCEFQALIVCLATRDSQLFLLVTRPLWGPDCVAGAWSNARRSGNRRAGRSAQSGWLRTHLSEKTPPAGVEIDPNSNGYSIDSAKVAFLWCGSVTGYPAHYAMCWACSLPWGRPEVPVQSKGVCATRIGDNTVMKYVAFIVLFGALLGALFGAMCFAGEARKPVCSSRNRGQFWPQEANFSQDAARQLFQSGQLEMCSLAGCKYRWMRMSVNARDLVKGRNR